MKFAEGLFYYRSIPHALFLPLLTNRMAAVSRHAPSTTSPASPSTIIRGADTTGSWSVTKQVCVSRRVPVDTATRSADDCGVSKVLGQRIIEGSERPSTAY